MAISKKIIVVGGGAAGFFAAVNLAMLHSDWIVTILEKNSKLLSKVKISGGGRCNVTHQCFDNEELVKNYPRGHRELRQVFARFNVMDTIAWFKKQGVKLKTEGDGRMFPVTDNSQTIIDCFLSLAEKHNIRILTRCEVFSVQKNGPGFNLKTAEGTMECDAIIYAAGGHPKEESYHVLKNIGHTIKRPIPSLFTFNMPAEKITRELQGISVKNVLVKIPGSRLANSGPVLITHWGLSGPAVLKLSAFAAEYFDKCKYISPIEVNWLFPRHADEVEKMLKDLQKEKGKSLPFSNTLGDLPKRLWEFLCTKAGIDNSRPLAEISNRQIGLLASLLTCSRYSMEGKTTFREEFVTSGGVSLKEVDFRTMESKLVPGLFFCGEVLDIDAITGGFNFQNAWSTAWICANSVK